MHVSFRHAGAEAKVLPAEVSAQTKVFFERNIEWLAQAYTLKGSKKDATSKAIQTISILEGAMIISNAMDDIEAFDKAIALLYVD